MTVSVTAMWMHGNAVVVEHPENLFALDHKGWGPEFKLQRGTNSWFHIAIPAPLIIENQRSQLVRVFLCFNTPEGDGHISEMHLYDGSDRFHTFDNLFLVGDRRAFLMSGYNTFALPNPRLLNWGLGISFLYQAAPRSEELCPPSFLSIAGAGGDFVVEQQRQLHEDLTQQQTQYERDVAALRAQLEEEVQAREALAQQVATLTAQKTTQRRRKPDA